MFGDIIKRLRIAHNFSQVQLAKELTVSKQTVSNWEKISKFFSVSTDFLLELDDRRYIEITGLTETQLAHIQQIIRDITDANI